VSRASRQRQSEQIAQTEGEPSGRIGSVNAVMHSVEFSSYSGPLPHPEILRSFEEVVPGSAQRIFTQFEEQSAHRRSMEASVISSGAFSQRLGTISASLIGLAGVTGGLWLTHEGKSLEGLSSLFGTLATLVGTYFYKRKEQDKEREDKRDPKIKDRK
jgi:uncharacterized membrane protein